MSYRKIISHIDNWLDFYSSRTPCTPVFGLSRSILAFGTLITLLFNRVDVLFLNLENLKPTGKYFYHYLNLFGIFGVTKGGLIISKYLGILILLSVIFGRLPKITGILHWWVTFSFMNSSTIIDGGDTIASTIALFFVPLTLFDYRKSHWAPPRFMVSSSSSYVNLFLWSLILIIRLQISFIYFHAGVDKFKVDEWVNGTSTYYWFNNETFGASGFLKKALLYLTTSPFFVTVTTWGTLILEVILGMSLFMDRKANNWAILLIIAIVFHLGIVVIFGLLSFFMTMVSCLIIYLVPLSRYGFLKQFSIKLNRMTFNRISKEEETVKDSDKIFS